MSEIAIAYDVATLEEALALDARLGDGPELAKVGLQLFAAAGPEAVRALRARGRRVFLDLKLHDIPNTVRGAAEQASKLGAELITVHGMGGAAMVRAAVEGARRGGEAGIVAVTVLTSLSASTAPPGFASPLFIDMVAARLLRHAERAGARGIVCAAADLASIRALHPAPFFAVTPGIRPEGAPAHDQARVTTITEAVRLGSSLLVLGRAVTGAPDPRRSLEAARMERDSASVALPTPAGPSA